MKFAKVLQSNADQMPEEWRPYLIHYKALKKRINAIVEELEDRGLPSPIIKTLLHQSIDGQVQRLEYSFNEDEDQQHVKTCIRVVLNDNLSSYGPLPPEQEEQLSQLLAANEISFLKSATSSSSDLHEHLLTDSEDHSEVSSQASVDTTPPISPYPQSCGGDNSTSAPLPIGDSLSPSTLDISTPLRPSPLSQPPLRFIELDDDSDTSSGGLLGKELIDQCHDHQPYQGAASFDQPNLETAASDSNSTAGTAAVSNADITNGQVDKDVEEVIDLTASNMSKKHFHQQTNRNTNPVITTDEDGKR
ncbi:hypothetical protein BGW42_001937 [Actinomortierella wolfii]|nr:hypothetical protein BGW42_001937 [Actinomortierella wolfii]